MDEFEFTKIAGAVLAALLLIFGTKTIIDMNVGHTPEKPGFTLPAPAPDGRQGKRPRRKAARRRPKLPTTPPRR